MVEHIWSVPCNHALIDRETNSLSLLLIIDRIMLLLGSQESFDAAVASGSNMVDVKFVVMSLWVRSDYAVPEEAIGGFRLIGPSGRELRPYSIRQEFPIDLSQRTGFRSRVSFNGFPIMDGVGIYWIEIGTVSADRSSWERVTRLPINVALQDGAPPKTAEIEAPPITTPKKKGAKAHRRQLARQRLALAEGADG